MRGLLRRLWRRAPAEEAPAGRRPTPWYLKQEREATAERLEAARRRLKETIPPPEAEEPGG